METSTARRSRCTYFKTCGSESPSDRSHLAFFQDKSKAADGECKHCSYTFPAHDQIRVPPNARKAHMRHVPQHEFEQRTEGREYDEHYCGCFGWD